VLVRGWSTNVKAARPKGNLDVVTMYTGQILGLQLHPYQVPGIAVVLYIGSVHFSSKLFVYPHRRRHSEKNDECEAQFFHHEPGFHTSVRSTHLPRAIQHEQDNLLGEMPALLERLT
jgi:hypothetical protein